MLFERARFRALLAGTFFLLNAGMAQESVPAMKPTPAVKSKANAGAHAAKRKGTPKLVDLNSATKKDLMALPGITAPLADKIVAGRPYNSKFNLLTRSIVPKDVFAGIRKRIEVK